MKAPFCRIPAILVNTDSGTGTVEGIDKIANFMMKKYADPRYVDGKENVPRRSRPDVLKRATIPKAGEIDLSSHSATWIRCFQWDGG